MVAEYLAIVPTIVFSGAWTLYSSVDDRLEVDDAFELFGEFSKRIRMKRSNSDNRHIHRYGSSLPTASAGGGSIAEDMGFQESLTRRSRAWTIMPAPPLPAATILSESGVWNRRIEKTGVPETPPVFIGEGVSGALETSSPHT